MAVTAVVPSANSSVFGKTGYIMIWSYDLEQMSASLTLTDDRVLSLLKRQAAAAIMSVEDRKYQ